MPRVTHTQITKHKWLYYIRDFGRVLGLLLETKWEVIQ
uniref:Uncharacterized protein n=1 Tax=Rhizophora mucronata TaxID=61149 RepID=A0A2P2PU99_RHIMU